MTTDLGWFHNLLPDEQIELLSNPYQNLPGRLVERLMHAPGVAGWRWVNSSDPTRWMLSPPAASTLSSIRLQLENWWNTILTASERAYIIEHRSGVLAGEYAEVVQSASANPINDPDALVVVVARDAPSGQFRLPPIVKTFVDIKATEAA